MAGMGSKTVVSSTACLDAFCIACTKSWRCELREHGVSMFGCLRVDSVLYGSIVQSVCFCLYSIAFQVTLMSLWYITSQYIILLLGICLFSAFLYFGRNSRGWVVRDLKSG